MPICLSQILFSGLAPISLTFLLWLPTPVQGTPLLGSRFRGTGCRTGWVKSFVVDCLFLLCRRVRWDGDLSEMRYENQTSNLACVRLLKAASERRIKFSRLRQRAQCSYMRRVRNIPYHPMPCSAMPGPCRYPCPMCIAPIPMSIIFCTVTHY